mgnify:FL=1
MLCIVRMGTTFNIFHVFNAVYENYMCFVRYCVVAFVRIFFDHNLIIYKNKAKDVVSQILNLSLQP